MTTRTPRRSLFLILQFVVLLAVLAAVPAHAQIGRYLHIFAWHIAAWHIVQADDSRSSQSDLADAERQLAKARAAQDRHAEAMALQFKGRALRLLRRYSEAADAFLEAAALWNQLDDAPGRATALGAAGVMLSSTDAEKSKALIDQAIDLALNDRDHMPEMGSAMLRLGLRASEIGRFDLSRLFFHASLTIRAKAVPGSLDEAWSLMNLGWEARLRGAREEAAGFYRRALAIRERQEPNSLELAGTLHDLGLVTDGDEAVRYYKRALAIRGRLEAVSLDTAWTLTNMGRFSAEQ